MNYPEIKWEEITTISQVSEIYDFYSKEYKRIHSDVSYNNLYKYAMGKTKTFDVRDLRNVLKELLCLERMRASNIKATLIYDEETRKPSKKKWSGEDDELLVELASQKEKYSPFAIPTILVRTPSECQNRLSKLVGVKRDSKPVDGIFKGIMQTNEDGSADICGRVFDR